jgi:chorismate mutase
MTTETLPKLDDLRRDIDRIDAAVHALLIERSGIIDRLIAAKRTAETGSAFRPAREADMLRRLVARHSGRLPIATIEHLWRTIISTFTHVQAPYAVHVDARAGAALRDAARFQFGFEVPLQAHDGPQAVIEAVAGSTGDLGIVALGDIDSPWWELLGAGGPRVMARLPFLRNPDHPVPTEALVLAKPLGEAAAAEITAVAVERAERPADGAFGGELLAEYSGGGRWHGLVAVESDGPPDGARPVGDFARPIDIAATETKA